MRVPNFETGMLKWFFQLQDRKFEILNLSTIDNLKTLCGVDTVFSWCTGAYILFVGDSTNKVWIQDDTNMLFLAGVSFVSVPILNDYRIPTVSGGFLVAYLNMYIKPFLPSCRTSFRMDVWHLVWLRWCAGTLIRRACMCLFTSTNPLSTGRQLVDSKTIKPSNPQTTFNIFNNISLNYPLKLEHCMALLFCIFLCEGRCQKPSENQTTSLHMLHYPLENIWLIFMKWQQCNKIPFQPEAQCSNDPCTRCPLSAQDILRISWGRVGAAPRVTFESGASSSPWSLGELWEL